MQQVFLQWHSPPLLSSRSWVEPLQYAFFTALPCLALLAQGIFFSPPFLWADIMLNRRVFSCPFSPVSIWCKNEDRCPLTTCGDDGGFDGWPLPTCRHE
jgi:hypothetical protein